MKRLKPNQRIALLASSLAIFAGVTPLLMRSWSAPGQDRVLGMPAHFAAGFLLGMIGALLVGGVALGLKTGFFGGPHD
ncbi:hypothetical protein [Phenylobacterium sp.]|uniref:hypothetical protein n=1 Tax=Phenylobacterium sp. TaxID=1871053 RepID=UPI002DE41C45|nr:hypothetical protein [Phenylobacterium sp.]